MRVLRTRNHKEKNVGTLMHISSLPSPHGIGTLGADAFSFIDWLVTDGQKVWQVLPQNPVTVCGSPYSSYSAFAMNPYYIDIDSLISEGLLTTEEAELYSCDNLSGSVDFELLEKNRMSLLRLAFSRSKNYKTGLMKSFCELNAYWLDDHALYCAAREYFGNKAWYDWDDAELVARDLHAIKKYQTELKGSVMFHKFLQFIFSLQWSALRKYANKRGIRIMGDMPIYVSLDSADVWANRELYLLDSDNVPTSVAGVPPDYFSEDGQLWGNPLYDWNSMARTGYVWWKNRIKNAAALYDIVRIDHFRAFSEYYSVPSDEKTAKNGQWVKGPGKRIINAFNEVIMSAKKPLQIVAEDLGIIDDKVRSLLKYSGYPGMRVIQFGFDGDPSNPHLPHMHDKNCVCYTGTHDNATLAEWYTSLDSETRQRVDRYFDINASDTVSAVRSIIEGTKRLSAANLIVIPIQDRLILGASSRMNTPGIAEGNWTFRVKKTDFDELLLNAFYE